MDQARPGVVMLSPGDLAQLKTQLLKHDDGPNERKPKGQVRSDVLFEARMPASRQDDAGQACLPNLSVTAVATNFLRPALPGLVLWAAHQSGNVEGSM